MSASLRPLTLAEFLEWERSQAGPFEFDSIQPVAMTGGSVAHARLVRRIVAALASRLPAECEAFGGDLKVLTPGRVRYPDVTVVCGSIDLGADSVDPCVVGEVLSPSTALTDRRVKAAEYTGLASVLAYIMFEQDQPTAIVLRRSAGWREEIVTGVQSAVRLPELGLEFGIAELYQ